MPNDTTTLVFHDGVNEIGGNKTLLEDSRKVCTI